MSLKDAKIGDLVVAFPYGLGEFVDNSDCGDHIIKFPHKDIGCGLRKCYNTNGSECGYKTFPPSCWPVYEAPRWVWEALGIEKPKRIVKKEIMKYCVVEKDNLGVKCWYDTEMGTDFWLSSRTRKELYAVGKATIVYEVEE